MFDLFKKVLGFTHPYSGIIVDTRTAEARARDKIAGDTTGLPIVSRVPSGDWSGFKCLPEAQNIPFVFDTMACVTFSAGETIECQIIWMLKNNKVPDLIVARMKQLGFFKNPDELATFKISKRFNAITNGTDKNGNYFWKVADNYRNVGFIPDKMLPLGGGTIDQYYNHLIVTNEMVNIAREMLSYFKIEYEFIPILTSDGLSRSEIALIDTLLTTAPLQIAVPTPATHAQMLYALSGAYEYILDTYQPYTSRKPIDIPRIDYGMRYLVTCIGTTPISLIRNLYIHMRGDDVGAVQRFLGIKADNYFGPLTKEAIIAFQRQYNLTVDGIWGSECRIKMSQLQQ